MKVAELLERRRKNWQELEVLCDRMRGRRLTGLSAEDRVRFAALYRAACADLALADAYALPTNTVQYLHRLVGRAHNQFYRTRKFDLAAWGQLLLVEVPQRVFHDRCIQLTFVLFWGVFLLSALLAFSHALWPNYAEAMLTQEGISQLETSFQNPIDGRDAQADYAMAGFYIQHNTGIGLECFAFGLFTIPGLWITVKNAVILGASFGYMARPEVTQGENFFHFVAAHGPFELTAIALSAGAGLRLGMGWLVPGRLTRQASLVQTAREAMPLMGAAMCLFAAAALIEGFVSPSALPPWFKELVAILSAGILMFYFVVLGFPRRLLGAAG